MKKYLYFIWLLPVFVACLPKPQNEAVTEYALPPIEDVVIYQINPRVFAPQNSFRAILPHLDGIKGLGCNMLWFMPLHPIGEERSKNSPYAVKDYYAVNPEFGTMEDFKQLIDEAHKRGLGVMMDWVPNHTAWDNEWINNEGWYTRDEEGNINHPQGTDWTDTAELNFDNQDMRLAMIEAMKYWVVKVGIDGFRCDAVDHVPADFLRQCNDSLRSIPGRHLLLLAESSQKHMFDEGFDLNYGWEFVADMRNVYRKGESATVLFEKNASEYDSVPPGKYRLRFTTNHDEAAKHSPIVEWGSKEGSMSAYAAVLFFPGIPMIYGSQEVGYPAPVNFFNYVKVDWNANPEIRKEYATLLEVYNTYEGLRKGDFMMYPDENILLFSRSGENKSYLVAINVRGDEAQTALPEGFSNQRFINLTQMRNLSLGETLNLRPYEYLILEKQ